MNDWLDLMLLIATLCFIVATNVLYKLWQRDKQKLASLENSLNSKNNTCKGNSTKSNNNIRREVKANQNENSDKGCGE
jgi:hypothetical protein